MRTNELRWTKELLATHVLAMREYMGKRVVALFLHGPEGYLGIGSGTCLQVAKRFFVATAAHNILDRAVEQIAVIGSSVRTDLTPRVLGFGLRGGRQGDAHDIAWIELPAEVRNTWTGPSSGSKK